jgi:hypothetical protein
LESAVIKKMSTKEFQLCEADRDNLISKMDDDLAYISIEGDLIWVDQTQGKHYSPEEARRFAKMLLEAADKVEAYCK